MSDKRFIDRNLIKIKDRLSTKTSSPSTPNEITIFEKSTQVAAASAAINETKIAITQRYEEYLRTKRDVLGTLSKLIPILDEKAHAYERFLDASRKMKEKLSALLAGINSIAEDEWKEKDLTAELAKAMRSIENARLEILRIHLKGEIHPDEPHNAVQEQRQDLTSARPFALVKAGFYFFLPLILGLLIAAGCIAWALLASLGGAL